MPDITDQPDGARQISPVSFFGHKGEDQGSVIHDFSPHTERVNADDPEEAKEVEETLTPAPKDESAVESAGSSTSVPLTELPASETPAPPGPGSPTELLEAAVKANGKDNEPSEDEPPTPPTPAQPPATSLPASSTPPTGTTPGFPMPPAPVAPPTSD